MGLRVPSLADMDAFEVNRKRKPAKLSNASSRRAMNVILWRVDGSAVVVHSPRTTDCCPNTLWRRMMCARHVGREKPQSSAPGTDEGDSEDFDRDLLELGEPRQAPLMKEAGSKLQSAFSMRRWPQGWI